MLNSLKYVDELKANCYSIQIVSPGTTFLGTIGWYSLTEDTTALYEMDIATTAYTEIK